MNYAYDIFLSHSSNDKQAARYLANELKHAGFKVWFDEWVIDIGDNIFLEIEQGLRSSRCMLVLMSESFFASEWTSLERSSVAFRDPKNKDKSLIPLLLSDCEVPDTLAAFKYHDFSEQTTPRVVGLINRLSDILGIKAKRSLHMVKLDIERTKDTISLDHGPKGEAYQEIVALHLGSKMCSLMFFDVDGFSYINGRYGVGIGERVLEAIGILLQSSSPPDAFISKWSADEFVCACPDLHDGEALEHAKNMVSAVNGYCWDNIEESLFVTISCGVSTIRRRGNTKEVEWIEAAILGCRSAKIKGGGDARIGTGLKSDPKKLALKTRAPLEYLDRYGS